MSLEIQNLIGQLVLEFSSIGAIIKVIPVNILPYVKEEWEKARYRIINTDMYQNMLDGYFDFSINSNLNQIKSFFLIAYPSPPYYVTFHTEKGTKNYVIPPVYIERDQQLLLIKKIVNQYLSLVGLNTYEVILPKKIMAAITGLGQYGHNNLLYVKGLGSCYRLTLFATDMECIEQIKPVKELYMQECKHCNSCVRLCKTGALSMGDMLFMPDKCLAYYNEREGYIPREISNAMHDCLFGCITCQQYCPKNKKYWKPQKLVEFDQNVYENILKGIPMEQLPKEIFDSFISTNLYRYYSVLRRNLQYLNR